MNRVMFTAAIVIGVGIAFGVGGYFAGQSAWDGEREDLESQLVRMEAELAGLMDEIRQRQMSRRGRPPGGSPGRAREYRIPQVPLRPEYWPTRPPRAGAPRPKPRPKAPTSRP